MSRFRNHDGAFSMPTLPEDRLPPQNLEAEQGVIGAALLDNATLHDTTTILKPGDFYRDNHQMLWEEIVGLYDAGSPVDARLVGEGLDRKGLLKRVGGYEAIFEITDSVPHTANAVYHAAIVRQKSVTRQLVDLCNQTLSDAYSNAFSSDQLIEATETRIFAIRDSEVSTGTYEIADCIESAVDVIEQKQKGEFLGVGTGWPRLDDITGGFEQSDLVIVAGRPSMGKSAVALNIAEHAAFVGGYHTLFVSLEMGRTQLATRVLMSQAKIDGNKLQTGKPLDRMELSRFADARRHVHERGRLRIDESPSRTVAQIGANARREKSRNGLDLLVIDYLQLLETSAGLAYNARRDEKVGDQTRRLKGLARELGIPVILLSQLNRCAEGREDHRPRMADLRDSGNIEQDADKIILVHRPEYYDPDDQPGVAELIVAKNRNGQTGTAKLVYLKQFTRFEALAANCEADDHNFN